MGNLLATNSGTLGVSGYIDQRPPDVNWYKFTVTLQGIERIAGVAGTGSQWPTIFDVDYADGLSRPALTLWVFDSHGHADPDQFEPQVGHRRQRKPDSQQR